MPVHDFQDGCGPVPAHQHPRGGGWVGDTAQVAKTAYVGPHARVSGYSQVRDHAQIRDRARVYGDAQVRGRAQVYDDALVGGFALVNGSAQIRGRAQVRRHVFTVTNQEATLLAIKYPTIKLELLDSGLVQVYDHDRVTQEVNHAHV